MSNCTYFDKETTVCGELSTKDLVIEGVFKGEIKSTGKVLLAKSAHIDASLIANKLKVEEGAQLNGTIILQNAQR